jgi:DNA-directed RNA polymerase beta subunit
VDVAIPYVFRYLAVELMAMNIRLTLDIQWQETPEAIENKEW